MATTPSAEFEQLIEKTFPAYLEALQARLYRIPPKFVPVWKKGQEGPPLFRLAGKGPFDVLGYRINPFSADAAGVIGAEIKHTGQPATSLPIIIPPRDSAGIDLHQLESLAHIAMSNGIARIIWNNGGRVCILREPQIILAYQIVMGAVESEMAKKEVPSGAKSIKATLFEEVQTRVIGHVPIYDWLALPKE